MSTTHLSLLPNPHPQAHTAKLYVHNTIVPGQIRTLLWSEQGGGASDDDEGGSSSSSSGPVQEMNYVPFVRFSTSTVYLVFEDVGMESSDDSSTDSYSVDVSLNGGDTYIGATVQQEAAHIQMSMELVGLDSADVGEQAQAGFKAVLNATSYNQTNGRFRRTVGDLSIAITDISDSTDSRRRRQRQRRLEAEVSPGGESPESLEGLGDGLSLPSASRRRELSTSSSSTSITFRLYSSSAQTVDVDHATSIMSALDNSTTLLGDLEAAMNVTISSAGVVEDSLSSYDPSISDFYTDPAFYVFPYVGHHDPPPAVNRPPAPTIVRRPPSTPHLLRPPQVFIRCPGQPQPGLGRHHDSDDHHALWLELCEPRRLRHRAPVRALDLRHVERRPV